jgi:hypothetical protein
MLAAPGAVVEDAHAAVTTATTTGAMAFTNRFMCEDRCNEDTLFSAGASVDAVCKRLGTSARTLQRRLREEEG